ncbi:MAG TPA: YcaO-like family protein [Solirubrobacteraceae bacterium]
MRHGLSQTALMAADWGRVEVFRPFESCPDIVFGRTAARSDAFGATEASGGKPIIVGSSAGSDEADVATRAHNELVERVSNVLAGRAAERAAEIVASFAQLRRDRRAALNPAAWGRADLHEAPMLWVRGRSLIDDRDVLVPAGAAFLRHRPPAGSPDALRAGSTGIAAHATTALATRHALREVLERDLMARSWFEAGRSWIDTVNRPWPSPLPAAFQALGLEASTLVLPGPPGFGCAVTCLHAPGRTQQSFGARCVSGDQNLVAGFERAAYEALMVRWSITTRVARRAWEAMRLRPEQPTPPADALEHALWTFHEQDSLGHWQAASTAGGDLGARPERELASAVADHTGEDIVVVDSAARGTADGIAVVRVVAPAARRLPAKAAVGATPHPFG